MKDRAAYLNRRTFLASTLVGGAALATGATLSGVFAQEEAVGEEEEVILTAHDPVVVREAPGVESAEVETLEIGDEVILGDEEPEPLDGFTWIPITVVATESTGWIASEYTNYAEATADADATPVATPEIDATPEPDATPDPDVMPDPDATPDPEATPPA